MMDSVTERFEELVAPLRGMWGLYQGLSAEQQSSVLWLAVFGVAALVVWFMYQTHGDDVVIVLPAMALRYSLILCVVPVLLVGRVAGAGWSIPEALRRDWTAKPDPDGPRIRMEEVNPMRLPGGLSRQERKDWKERFEG